MPSEMAGEKGTKRTRKPDFSAAECTALVSAIAPRWRVINCSDKKKCANQRRKAAWEEITAAVNAVGRHGRMVLSVEKKWKDLKNAVKNKPVEGRMTGGGPPPEPVPFEEPILAILAGSSTVNGIGK